MVNVLLALSTLADMLDRLKVSSVLSAGALSQPSAASDPARLSIHVERLPHCLCKQIYLLVHYTAEKVICCHLLFHSRNFLHATPAAGQGEV